MKEYENFLLATSLRLYQMPLETVMSHVSLVIMEAVMYINTEPVMKHLSYKDLVVFP